MGEKKIGRKGFSEEEFKKFPKAKQETILAQRAARIQRTKNLASVNLNEVNSSELTDSQYNAKFNKAFKLIRKGLLVLRAKKVAKILQGESLWNETIAFLNNHFPLEFQR